MFYLAVCAYGLNNHLISFWHVLLHKSGELIIEFATYFIILSIDFLLILMTLVLQHALLMLKPIKNVFEV